MGYFFRDSAKDPVTGLVNSSTEYWFFQSASSTGSSTLVYYNLTIPSSPNYPVYPAAGTRYIMNLPGAPYYNGAVAGTNPWYVVNITQDTTLVRVAYDATLTANTYKIFPNTQQRVNAMEVHVGVGSGASSDVISYSGYFENMVISSSDMNTVVANSVTSEQVITNAINSSVGLITFGSTTKVGFGDSPSTNSDVGGITINTTSDSYYSIILKSTLVDHGITDYMETNAYAGILRYSNNGGIKISCFTDFRIAYQIYAYVASENSTIGAITFSVATKSGTGTTAMSTGCILSIENNSEQKARILYDGKADFNWGGIRTKRVESANALSIANLDSAFGTCTTLGNGFHGIYKVTSSNTYAVWVTGENSTTWAYNQITVI